jgi:hypothetical protein
MVGRVGRVATFIWDHQQGQAAPGPSIDVSNMLTSVAPSLDSVLRRTRLQFSVTISATSTTNNPVAGWEEQVAVEYAVAHYPDGSLGAGLSPASSPVDHRYVMTPAGMARTNGRQDAVNHRWSWTYGMDIGGGESESQRKGLGFLNPVVQLSYSVFDNTGLVGGTHGLVAYAVSSQAHLSVLWEFP